MEAEYIKQVMDTNNFDERKEKLKKYFTITPIEIPSCFGEEESSYAIRITLKDHIKAQSMLPFLELSIDINSNSIGESAGKLLIDLGPSFDPNPQEGGKYPRGVMNAYCSNKTLPNLASEKFQFYFGKNDPKYDVTKLGIESAEIGYMLELGNFKKNDRKNDRKDIKDFNDKTIEEIENIRYEGSKSAKTLLTSKFGENVCNKIRLTKPSEHQKVKLGQSRLEKIFNKKFDSFTEIDYESAFDIAKETIKTFGFYLADQIALLRQNYGQMQVVVLGGGVLSGYTRYWAIKNAKERLKNCYNLELKYGRNHEGDFEKNVIYYYTEIKPKQGEQKQDYGIFGSALMGIREMLLKLNRDGIEEIRKIIISMKENEAAELTNEYFKSGERTVILKKYALDLEDVEKYLQVYSQKMGLLYSTRLTCNGKTTIKYRRWFSEQ